MIIEARGKLPDIEHALFIAPDAVIAGDVTIGENSSVWFSAVLRAEEAPIIVGEHVNIQDHVMIHADRDLPVILEEGCNIGHNAVVHGCTIKKGALVGMNATIMNGAVIGEGSVIAAGALVLQNAVIPPNSVVAGVPGKVKKTISDEQAALQLLNNKTYVGDAIDYARVLDYSPENVPVFRDPANA